MPEDLKIWEITSEDKLKDISKAKLNLEERLEKWLENDISILSTDLLLIGRQVPTKYGGVIDLLCLNSKGDVVILELKRDKTPREVTAQALDYASWVKDLSYESINNIANEYFAGKNELETAFREKFGAELPEAINSQHQIIIVASAIDSSTERIINYLAETYGVPINAATFYYFKDGDNTKEFLARKFVIEPEKIIPNPVTSKRKSKLSYEELQTIANDNGVGSLYTQLLNELIKYPLSTTTSRSTLTFNSKGGNKTALINLIPSESNEIDGLKFNIYINRLAKYTDTSEETLYTFLPPCEEYKNDVWSGLIVQGFFKTELDVSNFTSKLHAAKTITV